jgi:hypothetical protein
MKTVGHKGDEDVGLDAMGKLMKNWANPYISLRDAIFAEERRLRPAPQVPKQV